MNIVNRGTGAGGANTNINGTELEDIILRNYFR